MPKKRPVGKRIPHSPKDLVAMVQKQLKIEAEEHRIAAARIAGAKKTRTRARQDIASALGRQSEVIEQQISEMEKLKKQFKKKK